MELEELKLIKAVNGNNVIFNVSRDVKQHIEGSKGIDDSKGITEIADFKIDGMQENEHKRQTNYGVLQQTF